MASPAFNSLTFLFYTLYVYGYLQYLLHLCLDSIQTGGISIYDFFKEMMRSDTSFSFDIFYFQI